MAAEYLGYIFGVDIFWLCQDSVSNEILIYLAHDTNLARIFLDGFHQ